MQADITCNPYLICITLRVLNVECKLVQTGSIKGQNMRISVGVCVWWGGVIMYSFFSV